MVTPVLAPGTGPGAGRVDFPFGMAPEAFFLELRGAVAVFPQRIGPASPSLIEAGHGRRLVGGLGTVAGGLALSLQGWVRIEIVGRLQPS